MKCGLSAEEENSPIGLLYICAKSCRNVLGFLGDLELDCGGVVYKIGNKSGVNHGWENRSLV